MLKLLDEKGNLFGKINILDFIILLSSILICIALIASLNPGRACRIITGEPKYKTTLVKIVVPRDFEWIDMLSLTGETRKGRHKDTVAEILNKKWEASPSGKKYLTIDLKIKATIEPQGALSFYGRQLKPGEDFFFENANVKIKGFLWKVSDLEK